MTTGYVRHGRLRDAAVKRGVPLATILVTVAVVVLVGGAARTRPAVFRNHPDATTTLTDILVDVLGGGWQ